MAATNPVVAAGRFAYSEEDPSMGAGTVPIVSVEFDYGGKHRVVDNVSWREHDSTGRKVLVGLEIVVEGELVTQTVKRYLVDLIRELRFVDPDDCLALRNGPRS